ncbi:unnamed protein product [Thelazia callipaeda]|uniref:Uncharacterized protein n=1 Tax=Thelazia callipaeda TaxID=103827 RepID=A0A0N5D0M3_THECL|nr:unnamed protein product [Thelazia callipaeda]
MVRSRKNRLTANKKSQSGNTSPQSYSRRRSRSRSRNSTPRLRSNSRSRGNKSPKTKLILPVDTKSIERETNIKKIMPLHQSFESNDMRSYRNHSGVHLPRRPNSKLKILQRFYPNNLLVKGTKIKNRLFSHCRRYPRSYALLLILGLIALALFYTGYTVDQMAKYSRQQMKIISAYVNKNI